MGTSNIQSVIMRRVYYAYAVSIFTHTMFLHGVFMSVALYVLARLLHVASIVENFLSVPVGSVPAYVYNAFATAISSGELLTVLVVVATGGVALSIGHKLAQLYEPKLLTHAQLS
jgi:hypothetical protein